MHSIKEENKLYSIKCTSLVQNWSLESKVQIGPKGEFKEPAVLCSVYIFQNVSIFQDPLNMSSMVIVVRSLVPGGVAQVRPKADFFKFEFVFVKSPLNIGLISTVLELD